MMGLYQTQKTELVKAFSSLVSTEDGEVKLDVQQITPVECKGLGYCLQHMGTSVKNVE